MAQGIKTIDTIGHQLPTLSLVALFHCLNVYCAANYCNFNAALRKVELDFEYHIFQIKI